MSILDAYRAGVVPDDLDIVDVHGHLCAWPPFHTPPPSTQSMLEVMDSLGIRQCWVAAFEALTSSTTEGNEYTRSECMSHPGRLLGYAAVNPHTDSESRHVLEDLLSAESMIGIKLHPTIHQYPVDGPAYRDAWEVADEGALPVLVHTSGGSSVARPSLLVDLAKRYARARIIIGHSGLSMAGILESIESVHQADNLYLDTMGSRRHFRAIELMAAEAGADRMVFGTDQFGHDAAAQLGKVVYAHISDSEKRQILAETAIGLLEGVS